MVWVLAASRGGRELQLRRCVSRDMRRSGSSSTVRVEGEGLLLGPPKTFLDVKLERTHHGPDVHGADGKAKLSSESAAVDSVACRFGAVVQACCCLQVVWRE